MFLSFFSFSFDTFFVAKWSSVGLGHKVSGSAVVGSAEATMIGVDFGGLESNVETYRSFYDPSLGYNGFGAMTGQQVSIQYCW